jgi:hypothetical protein
MNRVVEIIEANHVFILIGFIAITFYLLWSTNSKLSEISKQVFDLKIKLDSLEKNKRRNTIDKFPEQPVINENLAKDEIEIDETVKPIEENNKLTKVVNNRKKEIYEYTYARFFVDQKMYDKLNANPFSELKINISPKQGNHQRGYYLIPNNVAINFIRVKQQDYNWKKNKNFHQDTVPTDLRDFFKYL